MSKTYSLTMYYTVTFTKTLEGKLPVPEEQARDYLNNLAFETIWDGQSNCLEWKQIGDPETDYTYKVEEG